MNYIKFVLFLYRITIVSLKLQLFQVEQAMSFQSRFPVLEKARHFWQTSSADTFKPTKIVLNGRESVRKIKMILGILKLLLVNPITLCKKNKNRWFGGNTHDTNYQLTQLKNLPTSLPKKNNTNTPHSPVFGLTTHFGATLPARVPIC